MTDVDRIDIIKTKFLALVDLFEEQHGVLKIKKGDEEGQEEVLEVSITMNDTCGGKVTAGIAGDFNHVSYGAGWDENTMIIAIAKAAFNEIIQRKECARFNPEEENNND